MGLLEPATFISLPATARTIASPMIHRWNREDLLHMEPLLDQPVIFGQRQERFMLSGFVFDVEGTLVDSVPQNLRSLQDALERFGHRVPYQTLHLYSGLDGDQTLQLVVPDAAEPERKEILEVQGTIYEKSYLDSVRPFDGVRDVFRALTETRRHGLRWRRIARDLPSNVILRFWTSTSS